jgi:1,4-dihydroxy-2-naphthoate octaprenyltransferase
MKTLRLFLQLSRPFFLLGAALLYALGVGIARYLGAEVDWGAYLLGQAWVTVLQLSAHYLNEYFDGPGDEHNATARLSSAAALGPGSCHATALWRVACLAVGCSPSGLLIQSRFAPVVPIAGLFWGLVLQCARPGPGCGELTPRCWWLTWCLRWRIYCKWRMSCTACWRWQLSR